MFPHISVRLCIGTINFLSLFFAFSGWGFFLTFEQFLSLCLSSVSAHFWFVCAMELSTSCHFSLLSPAGGFFLTFETFLFLCLSSVSTHFGSFVHWNYQFLLTFLWLSPAWGLLSNIWTKLSFFFSCGIAVFAS